MCFCNTKFFARRGDDELAFAEVGGRVTADPGRAEQLLGKAKPAAAADDDRAVGASHDALVADPSVPDVDDAVGSNRRGGIVTDDEGGPALLARELGDQVEHVACGCRVELACRLVGDQQVRASCQRRTDRDPLLLASGKLTRVRVAPGAQADPREQLVGARLAPRARLAGEPELDADELPRGQLTGERTPVMLVGVADRARAEARRLPTPEHCDIRSRHGHGAGGRAVESRHDPQKRRLARAARPQDDAQLTLPHGHGQPLQRGDAALGRAVDAEEIPDLDERGHSIASTRPGVGAVNARRVTPRTSAAATTT